MPMPRNDSPGPQKRHGTSELVQRFNLMHAEILKVHGEEDFLKLLEKLMGTELFNELMERMHRGARERSFLNEF